MWPSIAPEVLAALTRGARVGARLRASINGSAFTYPVQLDDGSVQVSWSSPVRRTLTATVLAEVGDPEVDDKGTELRAEYLIRLLDGTEHWIPVGTFVVTGADPTEPGKVRVTGQDRWRRIANARFPVPVTTSGLVTSAIEQLVEGADGRITCTDLTGSTATHGPALWERDRDKAVLDLAKSIGAQMVFDPTGDAFIVPTPSLAGDVDWRVYGGDGGVLIQAREGSSSENTYNAAVVIGEPPNGAAPVRSVQTVTSGPLRWGGPFGQRPRFYRSSLITTQAQADSAAVALLSRVTGVARNVQADTFIHPGLDAGDVLEIEVRPGVIERHLVESFTLPLGPGGLTVQTRTTVEAEGE